MIKPHNRLDLVPQIDIQMPLVSMTAITEKPWFDSKTGFLLLDEYVAEMPSFLKIMEDGVLTDEERVQQIQRVTALLKELEMALSPTAKDIATNALCELAVLHTLQQNTLQKG